MSNRFHNKLHRENHHSDPTVGFPDSSYDPIASYEAPWKGEFYSTGLVVTTQDLSAGQKIYALGGDSSQWNSVYSTVADTSGNWDSVYTTVQAKSGSWDNSLDGSGTIGYLSKFSATKELTSSVIYEDVNGNVGVGTITPNTKFDINGNSHIYGNGRIDGDLTIFGRLSTLGTLSYLDTVLTTTSAVSVVNIGGPLPALTVSQTGPAPVAQFFDDGNVALFISGAAASPGYVGIGTDTPATSFHINATDALILPIGDTLQRKNERGAIRYNSQLSAFEGYNGAKWGPLGGGVIDDDEDTYIDAENPDGSDNDELQFYTAGTQRVKINANGLVMQSGPITPTAGSGESNGILFPKDPYGGNSDSAFIRYQQAAGENTAFIFGTTDNSQDRLTLQQQTVDLVNLAYGRVGINRTPNAAANEMLSVNGNVNIIDTANAANSVTFTGQTTTAGAATVITARNDFLRVEVNGVSRYIRLFDVV